MELYVIPFEDRFLVYRPLRRLAFIANAALVRYLQDGAARKRHPRKSIEAFLAAIRFWDPDPPSPAEWQPSAEHRPTHAVLLMTSLCNLRCTYCYASAGEGPRIGMNLSVASAAIDAVCENARVRGQETFGVSFHGGGEPILNWDVFTAAVAYAKGKDRPCRFSLATNGVWTSSQRDFILENVHNVTLSFDGVREVHDLQRPRADGRGSFDAVMETMATLDASTVHYGVRMTATPGTFHLLPASVGLLCRQTRCPTFQVEPCYSPTRGEHRDPSPEEALAFARAFRAALAVARAAERQLSYSGARPWAITAAFCEAPETALVVTPEGDVVTCYETYDRRHPLISRFTIGRVAEQGVSVDMSKLRSFASMQAARRTSCEGCFSYWHCGGDCATRCLSSPGENRGRCIANREINRHLLAACVETGGGVWMG